MHLLNLLKRQAKRFPLKTVIEGSSGFRLTYAELLEFALKDKQRFADERIAKESVIAVALPNGVTQAVSILSAACHSICVPLSPNTNAAMFAELCDKVDLACLITTSDLAKELQPDSNIVVILRDDISVPKDKNGTKIFNLRDNNTAFILGTSGTTSAKKYVQYQHDEIISFAKEVVETLQLSPEDSCIAIMPFYHAHGLIICLLGSILSGGCIFCVEPFFIPQKFFKILNNKNATWYTASPSLHAAIVQSYEHYNQSKSNALRFIKSGASVLDQRLNEQLKELFKVPVIQSYALSEVLGVLSASPMPPELDKIGSVGRVKNETLVIINDKGDQLDPGNIGKIAVSRNIQLRYYGESETKSENKIYFNTGDLGFIDDDGFLFLTGREKEIINRAGQKISPYEIEKVFLKHTSITEAVAFPVRSELYGEEVYIAIATNSAVKMDVVELEEFIASSLPPYMRPSKYVFVQSVPKSQTGKYERLKLYNILFDNATLSNR